MATTDQNVLGERLHKLYQSLLKHQDDDHLRRISNTGEVKVPHTSSSWYQCAWCDNPIVVRAPAQPVPVVHFCQMCSGVVYCSATCQKEDWKIGRHRFCCRQVRSRKAVTELSIELSEENGVMDVFDRSNEMIFRLGALGTGLGSVGQNYLRERMSLVLALMKQAVAPMAAENFFECIEWSTRHAERCICIDLPPTPHWDRLALEVVLEHCIDLLNLDPVHTASFTRVLVVHCLLILHRPLELYQFVKMWNLLPHKLRVIHADFRDPDEEPTQLEEALGFALGPNTFWSLKEPQFMFEDQSELALRPPCQRVDGCAMIETFPGPTKAEVVNVLYLASIGLRLVARCLPIKADDITSHMGSFLGLTGAPDHTALAQQCCQLLVFANESIPGILLELIESESLPRPSQKLQFQNDDNPPILELLKTAWVSSKFAWSFLLQFVRKEHNLRSQVRVPKHNFLQHELDQEYRKYLAVKSNRTERRRIESHWEMVKDTPPVRQLLLEEMENGSCVYDYDFSISRVYATIMKEEKETTANEILLLGERDRLDLVDDEAFLAREHLLQVKHLPSVALFLKTHNIFVSDEGRPACVKLEELVWGMFRKGLATESNLNLLFGKAGWVSFLLSYASVD